MRKTSKNLKAYTLIEALIVVAIIAITASVILVSYSSSRTTQQLESAAREVEAAVREAQSYALTGYQGVVATDPCRFEVTWGGTAYSVTYWYKDASDNCNRSLMLGSYAVRNGVTFTSGGSFYYTPPYAMASFDDNDGVVESRVVPLILSGSSHAICVYENGLINNRTGASCP